MVASPLVLSPYITGLPLTSLAPQSELEQALAYDQALADLEAPQQVAPHVTQQPVQQPRSLTEYLTSPQAILNYALGTQTVSPAAIQAIRSGVPEQQAAQVTTTSSPTFTADQAIADYVDSLGFRPRASTIVGRQIPTGNATVTPVVRQPSVQAPSTVTQNPSANFYIQSQNPIRSQFGYENAPSTSVGGQLALASMLGMSPQQMLSGIDAIRGTGITESPYWQSQYQQALSATGDPDAALAHANLAATQAGENVAGVFARALAEPTQTASQASQSRMAARGIIAPEEGAVQRPYMSTAIQPIGTDASGNVLVRTPSGTVRSVPQGMYTMPNIAALSGGAEAFTNALRTQMQMTPGVGLKGTTTDPQLQKLKIEQVELRNQQLKANIDRAEGRNPRVAQLRQILTALPKDDPRREPYLEELNKIGEQELLAGGASTSVMY